MPAALNTANYDAANQQLTLGPKSATYDSNGNLQTLTDSAGTATYTWNARDQLVSLSGPGVTASFQYEAVGRRKSKTVSGTTTNFLYDGLNVVQELNGATPVANLLTSLGIDETLLRTVSVGARSFITDGLGSTLALTDSGGLMQSEYTYEPFGKTTATGAASTNAFIAIFGCVRLDTRNDDPPRRSCGVTVAQASPTAAGTASRGRGLSARRRGFPLAPPCSIGFRAGEYGRRDRPRPRRLR
jgi:YD repeat-containing protein